MPRVKRNVVEFTCDGLTYRAEFDHYHVRLLKRTVTEDTGKLLNGQPVTTTITYYEEDPKGLPGHTATVALGKDKHGNAIVRHFPQRIRHVTRCLITLKDREEVVWGEGRAKCSMRDTYDWRKGVSLAFERAVGDAIPEMPRLRGMMLQAFYRNMHLYPEAPKMPLVRPTLSATVVPPVEPPGRNAHRRRELAAIGFIPAQRNGLNLLLPPAQMPQEPDVVDGVVVTAEIMD